MSKRKIGNSHTTISVTWADKEQFRRLAKFVKKTKNGDMYESDAVIFSRILESYKATAGDISPTPHDTYPVKSSSPTHVQQG